MNSRTKKALQEYIDTVQFLAYLVHDVHGPEADAFERLVKAGEHLSYVLNQDETILEIR